LEAPVTPKSRKRKNTNALETISFVLVGAICQGSTADDP
jgi:hypothetical protein